MTVKYEQLSRTIPLSPVFTSLKRQINEKIRLAIENGDKNEEARLKTFYSSMLAKDYIFETPVVIGDSTRFCFFNRQIGFSKLDMLLTDKTVPFEEVINDFGYAITTVTTPEGWIEFKNRFNQTQNPIGFVKMNMLEGQPLIIISRNDQVNFQLLNIFSNWGFEKSNIRFDSEVGRIEDWALAELYFKNSNIQGDRKVKLYTIAGLDKFIRKDVDAYIKFAGELNPVDIMEMPSYNEGYPVDKRVTFYMQGSPVTDNTKLTLRKLTDNAVVPFTMNSEGAITFSHVPTKPVHMNSEFVPGKSVGYRLEYRSGDVTADVNFDFLIHRLLDTGRIYVGQPTTSRLGNSVTLNIPLTDTYYKSTPMASTTNVGFVIEGQKEPVSGTIVDGVFTTTIQLEPSVISVKGYIKFTTINGIRAISIPMIDITSSNPA